MQRTYWSYLVGLSLLTLSVSMAQSSLPLIRATSSRVAINDGGILDRNAWTLSPKSKPDVYTAERTRQPKWVTFYTDLDSIRTRVVPGSHVDFIILLNNRDSCYTRVVSAVEATSTAHSRTAPPDTIPFVLTNHDAIAVKAIINRIDTLLLHFDTGSFHVRLTKEAIRTKTHLLTSPSAIPALSNSTELAPVTQLQLGTMILTTPSVGTTDVTAQDMDGRFGYSLFEGKQVELDYDHHYLLIHSNLPSYAKRYRKTKLLFRQSFMCVDATFVIQQRTYAGEFLLDTGSSQAVIVDSAWVSQHHFPATLEHIKTVTLRNPKGVEFKTDVVRAPEFKLTHFTLHDVPVNKLGYQNPARFSINDLGNDVLKRFNLILDLQADYLYLKPNRLLTLPYRERS